MNARCQKLPLSAARCHSVHERRAAGELDDVETGTDPVFGLEVPRSVPGVPDELRVVSISDSGRLGAGRRGWLMVRRMADPSDTIERRVRRAVQHTILTNEWRTFAINRWLDD